MTSFRQYAYDTPMYHTEHYVRDTKDNMSTTLLCTTQNVMSVTHRHEHPVLRHVPGEMIPVELSRADSVQYTWSLLKSEVDLKS